MGDIKGYVYFLKAEGLPMVKIGMTIGDTKIRRKGIQTMSPVWLYSIGKISSSGQHPRELEREFHELFEPYRAWGEWFEFPVDEIGTLKKCFKKKNIPFDLDRFKKFWKDRYNAPLKSIYSGSRRDGDEF